MPQKNPSVTIDFGQMRAEVFERSTYDENKKTPEEYGRTENTHKKIRGRVSRQIGDEQESYRPEDKRALCTRRSVSSLYRGCSVVPLDILAYFRVLRCGLDHPEGFEASYAEKTFGLNRNRLTDMIELKRLFRMDKRLVFPLIPFSALYGGDSGLKRRLLDGLDYFSSTRAAGEIGRQLLFSQVGNEPSCFTYIHDFPIHGLDDVILLPLLEAIRKKCPVEFHQSSYTRQGINNTLKVYPLYILDRADLCGRRHLLAYPVPNPTDQAGTMFEIQKDLRTIRLDYIDRVEICPDGNVEIFNKAEEAAKQALNYIYNAGYKWRTGTETYEPKEISAAFLKADGVCDAVETDLKLHLGLNYSMKPDKCCIDGKEAECIRYKFKVYEANEMMPFFLARIGYIADLKGWANIGPRAAAHVADLKTLYSRTREEGKIMDDIPAPAAMTASYLNAFDQPNQGRTPPSRESYTLKKERLYNPYMSPFIPLYIRMPSIEAEVKAQIKNKEKAKKEAEKRQTEEIGTWLNGEIVSGFASMLFPDNVWSGMMQAKYADRENKTAFKLADELHNLDADHRISALGERPMTYDEICFVYEMLTDKKASLFFSDDEIQKISQVLSPSYHFFRLLDTLGADQEAFFKALKAVCQQEKERNQSLEALNAKLDDLATEDFQKVRTALEALKDTGKALEDDAVCRILHGYEELGNAARPEAYDPICLIEARKTLIDEMIARCTSIPETRQAEASAFLNSEACRAAGNVQGEATCLASLLGMLNAVQLDEPTREALETWLKTTVSALCEHEVPVKTGDAEADARALACWATELDAGMSRQLGTCPLTAGVHRSWLKTWIWEVCGVDPNAILEWGSEFAAPIHSFDPGEIAVGDTGAEEAFFTLSRALPARMARLGTASYLDSNKIGEVGDSNVFQTLLTAIHESANVRITMESGEWKNVQPLSLQYDKFEGCFSVLAELGPDGYGVFPLSSIRRADLSGNTLTPARTLADYHRQNRVFLRVSSARDGIERVMMALNAYDKRSLHVFYENRQKHKRYPFAVVAVDFATQDKDRLINTLFAFGSTVEVLDVDSERYPNAGAEIRKEMLARIDRQAELIEANAAWMESYRNEGWLRPAEQNRLLDNLKFVSANSLNYWMKRFESTALG